MSYNYVYTLLVFTCFRFDLKSTTFSGAN